MLVFGEDLESFLTGDVMKSSMDEADVGRDVRALSESIGAGFSMALLRVVRRVFGASTTSLRMFGLRGAMLKNLFVDVLDIASLLEYHALMFDQTCVRSG